MKERIFEVRHSDVFESEANEYGWRNYIPENFNGLVRELTGKRITLEDVYRDETFLINVKVTDQGNFMIVIVMKDREYNYLFIDIDSYKDKEDTVYLCEVKKLI